MQLTKFGHACVRLERDGRVLIIDPGIYSDPQALTDAEAVLVTHEHFDHVDRLRLAGFGVPVHAPAGASIPGLEFRPLSVGDELVVAGFHVRTVGGRHAAILDDQPDVAANLGYVIDERLYHPGDALDLPAATIETLLVPTMAPWLATRDAIAFVRAVGARRAFPIHDALLNELGQASVDRWLGAQAPGEYRRIRSGESVDLG
jgi:L-ascorbate metabolism protein UlaG (beta-lactamase superfamily)